MEGNLKTNGRQPKKKMEDEFKNKIKWKTASQKNGR
jgi:hypothetical protein